MLEVLQPSTHYSVAEHVKWISQRLQLCVDLSISISYTCSTNGCLCQVLNEALDGVWRAKGYRSLLSGSCALTWMGPRHT